MEKKSSKNWPLGHSNCEKQRLKWSEVRRDQWKGKTKGEYFPGRRQWSPLWNSSSGSSKMRTGLSIGFSHVRIFGYFDKGTDSWRTSEEGNEWGGKGKLETMKLLPSFPTPNSEDPGPSTSRFCHSPLCCVPSLLMFVHNFKSFQNELACKQDGTVPQMGLSPASVGVQSPL